MSLLILQIQMSCKCLQSAVFSKETDKDLFLFTGEDGTHSAIHAKDHCCVGVFIFRILPAETDIEFRVIRVVGDL